jgi:hypothetical protein
MKNKQLFNILNEKDPVKIFKYVKKIFSLNYLSKYFNRINSEFKLIIKLFKGKFTGYKACNTRYHNLKHTIDTVLAIIRLVDGYNLKNKKLPVEMVINLISAGLLHDTGYIQKEWDTEGTGAKYTKIHVKRSNEFVLENYKTFGLEKNDVKSINRFISCSGVNLDIDSIDFESEREKVCGIMLGTGDLLGQMADRVYLEKLLFLYYEFREAGIEGYNTEFDIIQKTISFYNITKERFEHELKKIYKYARNHFRERYNLDKNLYIESIDNNIAYINRIIEDDTSNFRTKLHRVSV